MIAQQAHSYAQIVNGKIQWIFTSAELPEWADSSEQPNNPYTITAIDITGITPAPQVGWKYTNGTFAP